MSDYVLKFQNQRIAQLVVAPIVRVELVQDGELTATERGDGCFGSTDMKVAA